MANESNKSLIEQIKVFLRHDEEVSRADKDTEWRFLIGIAMIAAVGLAIMSVLNIAQKSMLMLALTGTSSILLIIFIAICSRNKNRKLLSTAVLAICAIIFSTFVFIGGNDGFAALWIVFIPMASMTLVDFRRGFIISFILLILLALFFYTPLNSLLMYQYPSMFLLRFPFFYLIAFIFGTWMSVRTRQSRYEVLMQQREIDIASCTDVLTGLYNRLGFTRFLDKFDGRGISCASAMYSDVNGLHELNNTQGHEAGDRMLAAVGEELRQIFEGYMLFRMGGDEFVAVCPRCNAEKIAQLAKQFDEGVKARGYNVAVGCASWERTDPDEPCKMDELVLAADHEMLEQKRIFHQNNPQFDRRKA